MRGNVFESSLTKPKVLDTLKIRTRDLYDISYRVTSLDDFSDDNKLSTIMTVNYQLNKLFPGSLPSSEHDRLCSRMSVYTFVR